MNHVVRAQVREGHYLPISKLHPDTRAEALEAMQLIRDRFASDVPGGELTTCQTSRELMDHEHQRQGWWMERYGSCDRGCSADNLVRLNELNNFRTVCKWTLRPCPRARLSLIINQYRIINRPCTT